MSEQLGRYTLLKLLATGGMGEVFLARHDGPGGFAKMVVVKRILRHLARDQGYIDLFLNEARLAAQLQHPNITQVFSLEHEGDSWFISMEYINGRSLREVLSRARAKDSSVPATIACRLASQVLQGLHFAHELNDSKGHPLGILHRDVSPDNVLLSFSGVVKLIDFGIARAMTGAVTRVGKPKGKVSYMAPELTVAGAAVDRRADVYAVGVLLYEMLRLTRPPNVPSNVEEATTQPRSEFVPEVIIPRPLNDVLARALSPDPARRFATANAMSEALELYLMAVGQTVLPTHVVRYLEDLFGPATFDANASVVPLENEVSASGVMRVVGGTAPLTHGTAPLGTAPLGANQVPLGVSLVAPSASMPLPVATVEPIVPEPQEPVAELLARVPTLDPLPVAVGVPLEAPRPVIRPVPSRQAPPVLPFVPRRRSRAPLVLGALVVTVAAAGLGAAGTWWWRESVTRDRAFEPADTYSEAQIDGGEVYVAIETEPAPPVVAVEPAAAPTAATVSSPPPPVQVRRQPGRVAFKLAAATEVFYGGRRLGVTPLSPIEVPPGTATFVLRNQKLGVNRRVSVKVAPGTTVTLRAELP